MNEAELRQLEKDLREKVNEVVASGDSPVFWHRVLGFVDFIWGNSRYLKPEFERRLRIMFDLKENPDLRSRVDECRNWLSLAFGRGI